MPKCIGRACLDKNKFRLPDYPSNMPYRYKEAECKRACAVNSPLCTICKANEEKYMTGNTSKWHGILGGPLPPESVIEGSEWNIAGRAKYAANMAAAAAAGLNTPTTVKQAAAAARVAARMAATATKAAAAADKKREKEELKARAATLKAERAASKAVSIKRKTVKKKSSSSSSSSSNSSRKASSRKASTRRSSSHKASSHKVASRKASPVPNANATPNLE